MKTLNILLWGMILSFKSMALVILEDKIKTDKDKNKDEKTVIQPASSMSSALQVQLNSAINNLELQLASKLEHQAYAKPDMMLDVKENLSAQELGDRTKASQLMTYLDQILLFKHEKSLRFL